MKKLIYLVLLLSIFFYCGPKQKKVEKVIEDGVEVVLNHIEPYKIKGQSTTLKLKKEFSIDLAREDIGEMGLADSTEFDIDSDGNIYFVSRRSEENRIYKFDPDGNFITSFGRKGQGPGEIQAILEFEIDDKDNIIISDHRNRKLIVFNKDGNLTQEVRFAQDAFWMFPLENGKYLAERRLIDSKQDYFLTIYSLFSPELKEIKRLDTNKLPNPLIKGRRGVVSDPVFIWRISSGNIYIGNEDRGYEIQKYDLEGNLLRKVRKKHKPVKILEELRKKDKELYERMNTKVFIPKYWPPYHSFFADDEGRLFVKTFEEGDRPGEYMYDIFNPDGIFIGRMSLNIYTYGRGAKEVCAKAKKRRLYCLEEKESGYKELVVYKMRWE